MKKLLVSDFDGTFYYRPDYLKNIERVKRFVKSGNIFVIATGRNCSELEPEIKYHQIPVQYYICNDGGTIYNSKGKLIQRFDISYPFVKKLSLELNKKEFITQIEYDLGGTLVPYIQGNVNGILIRFNDLDKIKGYLKDLKEQNPEVDGYIMGKSLYLRNAITNKSKAIQYLLNHHLLFDYEQVYTVGDNANDVDMLLDFQGYAMENGKDEVKKIAKGNVKSVFDLMDKIDESSND